VFEPFVRGANVGTVGGMGLELSVSRKIVEGHGGRIDVQSGAAGGSTFVVWMPILRATHLTPCGRWRCSSRPCAACR
jgi:signal transduction histidine kinase